MNGAELWANRIILGLTPGKLADLLGPNPKTITNWEQRQSEVPDWVEQKVYTLTQRRTELINLIWQDTIRAAADNGEPEPYELVLLNREEDLPDYAPEGTTVQAWNNAVTAVYAEASQTMRPTVEWNRYAEGGE